MWKIVQSLLMIGVLLEVTPESVRIGASPGLSGFWSDSEHSRSWLCWSCVRFEHRTALTPKTIPVLGAASKAEMGVFSLRRYEDTPKETALLVVAEFGFWTMNSEQN